MPPRHTPPDDAAPPPAITAALTQAAAQCAARGERLTTTRSTVLAMILAAPGPIGAYALLDQLRARTGQGRAPTIYRALEFLVAQGLIHRIERLAAFVPCRDTCAQNLSGQHAHAALLLICEACHETWEVDDHDVADALNAAATRAGFAPQAALVELAGLCARCRAEGRAARA